MDWNSLQIRCRFAVIVKKYAAESLMAWLAFFTKRAGGVSIEFATSSSGPFGSPSGHLPILHPDRGDISLEFAAQPMLLLSGNRQGLLNVVRRSCWKRLIGVYK